MWQYIQESYIMSIVYVTESLKNNMAIFIFTIKTFISFDYVMVCESSYSMFRIYYNHHDS